MGNSFVLFDVSILISHGQFHCGNTGHTQNTDFPWVKSHFPVGKGSSGTATIIGSKEGVNKTTGLINDENSSCAHALRLPHTSWFSIFLCRTGDFCRGQFGSKSYSGSLHTRNFRRIHIPVFAFKLIKNGFCGSESSRCFLETGPVI